MFNVPCVTKSLFVGTESKLLGGKYRIKKMSFKYTYKSDNGCIVTSVVGKLFQTVAAECLKPWEDSTVLMSVTQNSCLDDQRNMRTGS
jgi:hypothetical protein